MTQELYKKLRPNTFSEVAGCSGAKKLLVSMLKGFKKKKTKSKFPHLLLFIGPSGCGKTTLARITSYELGCRPDDAGNKSPDLHEVNSADFSGIDMVRGIRSKMALQALRGDCRVWIIDEAHELTTKAQNAFLKILEDTPAHCYFMLATTDPGKLIKALKSRATTIQVEPLPDDDMSALLDEVAEKEGIELDEEVADAIIKQADGAPRDALVLLNQIMDLEDAEAQLEAILNTKHQAQAKDIFAALISKKNWATLSSILKNCKDAEDAEGIRRYLLAAASNTMLKSSKGNERAFAIFNVFRDNFFDCGKAGLIGGCYELSTSR